MMAERDTGDLAIVERHPPAMHEGGWSVLLVAMLVPILLASGAWMAMNYEAPEKGTYVQWAKDDAAACPAIAKRVDEFLSDDTITSEERDVIATLRTQARAAPGGLRTCGTPSY